MRGVKSAGFFCSNIKYMFEASQSTTASPVLLLWCCRVSEPFNASGMSLKRDGSKRQLQTQYRVSILFRKRETSCEKNVFLTSVLGPILTGSLSVSAAHISEHPNQQPSHKIQITMGSTEARVDYMGSSILMGVFSNADLQLQDEWKVNLCTVDTSLSEKRCEMMSAGACHATQRLSCCIDMMKQI